MDTARLNFSHGILCRPTNNSIVNRLIALSNKRYTWRNETAGRYSAHAWEEIFRAAIYHLRYSRTQNSHRINEGRFQRRTRR